MRILAKVNKFKNQVAVVAARVNQAKRKKKTVIFSSLSVLPKAILISVETQDSDGETLWLMLEGIVNQHIAQISGKTWDLEVEGTDICNLEEALDEVKAGHISSHLYLIETEGDNNRIV